MPPALPATTLARPVPSPAPVQYTVAFDGSGAWPALIVRNPRRGTEASLNDRLDPVGDAERHLRAALRGAEPPEILLIGLGLGYFLDAIERMGLPTRVLAFEPLADAIPHARARRHLSSWLEPGRLRIVAGPEYAAAASAWAMLAPAALPPVIVDPGLSRCCPELVAAARAAVVRSQYGSAFDPRCLDVRQSMLHPHVLMLVEHAAATTTGAVVEIGAYVGGATVAMTRGIRDSGRDTPMFTIEPGGAYPGHPHLPSSDIFGDLVANLAARGLRSYVRLLQGLSSDPAILDIVRRELADRNRQIGVLCIDADGNVQRDFDLYLPLCAHGCVLAIDDYTGPPENVKTDRTRQAVDALVARGRAKALGVFGWGTWMGLYTPGRPA